MAAVFVVLVVCFLVGWVLLHELWSRDEKKRAVTATINALRGIKLA